PTNASQADIRGCADLFHAPPRGLHPSGLIQPSIGELLPHCIARVPAGIALPLWFCRCLPVPSEQSKAPATPPVQHNFIPNPIPSANGSDGSFSWMSSVASELPGAATCVPLSRG